MIVHSLDLQIHIYPKFEDGKFSHFEAEHTVRFHECLQDEEGDKKFCPGLTHRCTTNQSFWLHHPTGVIANVKLKCVSRAWGCSLEHVEGTPLQLTEVRQDCSVFVVGFPNGTGTMQVRYTGIHRSNEGNLVPRATAIWELNFDLGSEPQIRLVSCENLLD